MLTTRQWRLKDWLEANHIKGRYWTIEEIVENVTFTNGEPCYKLNTNPLIHDKCAALGADVKAINWDCEEGQKIIIKDKQGGVKLAESEVEFNDWRLTQLAKLEKSYQYLNNLKWKAKRDGQMPIINQALNPVDTNKDLKEINCYTDKRTFTRALVCIREKTAHIVKMVKYHFDEFTGVAECILPNDEKVVLTNINESISLESLEKPFYEDYKRIIYGC